MGKINVFTLVMMNIAAICSIKNWGVMAELGTFALFFIAAATIAFFIPVALVSAELATGWSEEGGVYAWVKAAFGQKLGFLSMWYLWLTNIPWYPTLLSFIAGAIAFSFNPELANNKLYIFCTSQVLFWVATWINLRGLKISGMVSSIGAVLGTVFPGCVIIGLGFVWFFQGRPLQIGSHWIPDLSNFDQLTLLAGVFLSFAGIEMSAIHARSVDNPQKSYPKAIFLSALLIAVISTLGTLTIASVIPKNELSLVSGGLDAFTLFLSAYGLEMAIPIAAGLIAIGAFSQMSTWIAGPSLGLLAASQTGDWPEALRKKNRDGMPAKMMLCQAVIVSILSLIFLYLPSLSSSFWLLIVLTAQFYLLLYILMFSAAIWLRIKKPEVERVYRVPGGKWGMFLVAGVGIGSSSFAFLMGFIPPDQWANGQTFFYVTFLVVGVLVGTAVPSILSWIAKRQRRFDAFKI